MKTEVSQGFPLPLILLFGGAIAIVALSSQQPSPPGAFYADVQVTNNIPPPDQDGYQETHWVVGSANCRQMERKFQSQGRRLQLVDIVRNPYGSGNNILKFGCIFRGPDARVNFYGGDRRYDGADAWTLP